MNNIRQLIIIQLFLISFCLCEISVGQNEKLLTGFLSYYNNLPNQIYKSDEGSLQSTQQVDETTYQIVANLKVKELQNPNDVKLLRCTATVQDLDSGVSVVNNHCGDREHEGPAETASRAQVPEQQVEVVEPVFERTPVQLENEVQSDTIISSGEQFVAIPRDQPSAPCIGCASHVNPQAAGVSDLANLGIRHLDIHEPSVKHNLDRVLDVERQVQVVNGVRYILTLSIISNNCGEVKLQDCSSSKICKITILVKPWVKLPNGNNYRAILGNNCTEEWQYGDNGEVLPELPTDSRGANSNDDVRVKINKDLQNLPYQEKTLTDEEIKEIQEQIIPHNQFQEVTDVNHELITPSPDTLDVSKQHVFKNNAGKHNENSLPGTASAEVKQQPINQDKKKAIDDMLDFFYFSGFQPTTEVNKANPRIKRSYDNDLQILSLAEDFQYIRKSIENAKHVYDMAQAMVDYLNEMDMGEKNRVVEEVIKAEEETESFQHYLYVQARVIIPCDKVECEPKDVTTQICNGVIDSTNSISPQILNTFCYNINKEREYRDVVKEIYLDDPVLQTLAKEAVKKIESETNSPYALKINKIVSANTQVTSGTLTKISIIIENINCNKSVPLALRLNCTVLEQSGSKICEVIIHERYWLNEKKISYTCTDRPVDMRISKTKSVVANVTVDDPKINEMLQEAIQYLETQSNRNNKQKIVRITSISSQIVAGFLTKIEFIVGYTNCTNDIDFKGQLNVCDLLENESLRICKAQIWDRSWIIDGKQVEVSCDDIEKDNNIEKSRQKRSIDFVGGQLDRDTNNNNTYLQLAKESLKRFLQSSPRNQHYVVINVDRVTVQAVSGKLTRIDFTISPTNCSSQKDENPTAQRCKVMNSDNIVHCHSKILEQVWLDKKQYYVNCDTKDQQYERNNQSNVVRKHNPSDSKYYQLAEKALNKYLKETGNSIQHKIVRVEKVTTQINSGLLTSIDFTISPYKSNSSNNTIKCNSKILEKRWLMKKEYKTSCKIEEKNTFNDLDINDLDYPKYMQIAVESLQIYLKNNPDSHLVRVTFVDKVTYSINGMKELDFLASQAEDNDGDTVCHAEYLEESQDRNYINVQCHLIGAVLKKSEISKEDPNYFKYVVLADESFNNYLKEINSSKLYTIISIENVTVTWDKGIKTLIKYIASPLELENNEPQGLQCISQIQEQPWLHKKKINVSCAYDKEIYRTKRQVFNVRLEHPTGGLYEQDPSNPDYKMLAEESLQKYKDSTGSSQALKVGRVEKVTTQIVAGVITRIDFVVSDGQDSSTGKCHSEIWEQGWLNKKDIKVNCELGNARAKREGFGGLTDQDPNRPQYKALAEESLQKYKHNTGNSQSLKVDKVEKVTTQVVAGVITRIDFVVSDSQDSSTGKCHSEVWEQNWLNKKDIKVNCELGNARAKREVLGGENEENPSDHQYIKLAEESLQKYKDTTGSSQALKVGRVEKVTTQIVAGVITRIDFVVSDGQDSSTGKCHSEIWEQSWLNKKDIKVNCELGNERAKRQLVGGPMEQNSSDHRYIALAEESLQKYKHNTGSSQSLKVDKVEKVTTQVVAGVITLIDFVVSDSQDSSTGKCHSEVWEQNWLNKKDIKVNCELGNARAKRQTIGGIEQDPSRPHYKALAEESLEKYMVSTGSSQSLKVDRIEKVTTHVVAGVITRIDFIVSDSQDSSTGKCHSEIWEQGWLNKKDIKVNCELGNARAKREGFGGLTDQDPNRPQYKALAEESLQKYKHNTGNSQSLKVDKVEKVTTQVVAGVITRIDFVVSDSQDSSTGKCHSEVWEQNWLNKKDIKVNCELGNERAKREVLGGEKEENPSDHQYIKLAEESLQKYKDTTGSSQALKVGRVEKVTTQIVAGVITRIDFVVSDGQDSSTGKCHSEIWEQSWLNKKDIKVNCELGNERAKRQLVGGPMEQNSSDHRYIALAEESLQKYKHNTGSSQSLKVDKVEKVTTQVVAGVITLIDFVVFDSQDSSTGKCHSEVWEQNWLNKKDIKVNCELGNARAKRQTIGGIEQDPSRPHYKALAEESLEKYMVSTGSSQSLKVDRIEKVTTHVVAGVITRIDFIVSDSQDSSTGKCHSEIWEQGWLNKKDIKVNCELGNARAKREGFGGLTEQDPNRPQYKALAEESLQKYKHNTGSSQSLKVDKVEKVTTQVVAGVITRIDFVVSDSQDSSTGKCHSEVWEQNWLNKKDIKVNCELGNARAKREVLGGEKEENPSDHQYIKLAEESLQKYKDTTGSSQALKVGRVEKVTTQIVAGVITRIDFVVSDGQDSSTGKCHSEVWEQNWLNKKDIKVNCELGNARAKRQTIGGIEQDPSRPHYKALAEESLEKYMVSTGSSQSLKVDRIEKVTTHVVAGVITRIDFIVSDSQDSSTGKCHSEIWEQGWLNKKDIKVNCELGNARAKREVFGGEKEENPSDHQYIKLAEESLQKYKDTTGSSQALKVGRVEKVTTQIVAGVITRIDFVVSDGQDSSTGKCHSEVWEQNWLNKKDIKVNCELGNARAKRQTIGGIEQDPSRPHYKALAEESLEKYMVSTGSSQSLKVDRIEKVTTHVVAGVITRIDFIVSDSQDSSTGKCHSEIWEQGWLNKKDIKVNCELGNARAKREVLGGEKEENPSDHQYIKLAEESLQKYKDTTGSSQALKVGRVEKVTTQIVAGVITRIDFVVSDGQDSSTGKCHSEVWEQNWLNKKDIKVNCELGNARAKRQTIGGIEQDPSRPHYKALAEESLEKYMVSTGSSQSLKVDRIEKVTTHVVAGVITRIDFIVSDSQDSSTGKCHSEIWEQGWLNKKDIKVNCELGNARAKREGFGGLTDQDPNRPQYKALAEESLQKYKHNTGNSQSLKVDKVEKVTTQVVAGVITRIDFVVSDSQDSSTGKCHSEVWEQNWLNKKDIKVNCELGNARAKREVLGGENEENPSDHQYIKLAEESLQKYKDTTGSSQALKVGRVEKVTTQIVAGVITRIDFVVSDGQDSSTGKCHSEIWEQSWLNKKDIKVNCELGNERAKRQLVGGPMEQNSSDHRYIALAEESLQKYKHNTGSSQSLKVDKVEKVTTQVVAGVITLIDFVVSDSQDSSTGKCHSEVWEQNWLNKKDIKVNCELGNARAKRQTIGGIEQDPSRPHYKALAEESLEKYMVSTGSSQSLKVDRIEKVTTHVVAGVITRIDFIVSDSQDSSTGKCHSEIWEQGWLNKKDIKVNCELGNARAKREGFGGLTDQDPNRPQYKALAEESLQKYKHNTGNSQSLKVDKVEKVTTQVVAGVITRIDFVVSDSQDSSTGKCHSEVWEQNWLNKKDIKVNCELGNARAKREVLGGENEENPSDHQYIKLAEESLQKYKDTTGSSQALKVGRVEKVTTQIVAGVITRIDFVVSDGQDSSTGKCHSEIWEQSWLNKKDIKVNCELGNERAKRQLVGGPMEQNSSDHRYIALAEESLQKYKHNTGSSQSLKVDKVEKVTTQVVAGVITLIDFVVTDSQDSSTGKCHSEVWEQNWLNKKDIKVNCELGNARAKRQTIGGIEQDPSRPHYKALAEESLEKYMVSTGSSQSLKVDRIEKVTTHVVAGVITRIDFIVSDSQDSSTGKCHSEIWEQGWLNKKDIKVNCELGNARAKREGFGGLTEQDPNRPQYKALAEESLQKYKHNTGSSQSLKVDKVEKVTTQVVAGVITLIDFVVSDGQDSSTGKCHSEIWEQNWLNKKDIKVNCELGNVRAKRQFSGDLEQNPSRPQYKALAEESLQKYIDTTGSSQSLKVDTVVKVTTYVVAGVTTCIDFIVIDSQDSSIGKCHSEVWEQSSLNKKDIKVDCKIGNGRANRHLLGGENEENPSDHQYIALAEESLQHYKDSTGSSQSLKVDKVEKVTTQVVAGVVTRIDYIVSDSQDSSTGKCHSEVWEQSWLNNRDIKVNCEIGNARAKRKNLGGEIIQNPSRPQYIALAKESLRKYKDSTGGFKSLRVDRVAKVTTQVVSGVITRIDFTVSDGINSNIGKCHSEVWEQNWLNKKDIKVNCKIGNERAKRQLVGGQMEQNSSDHRYIALAEESLQKYKNNTGSSQSLKVDTVVKVTTQLVNGLITRIDFVVSDDQDSSTGVCHSEVWEQSWLNLKNINVSCQNQNRRNKRQVSVSSENNIKDATFFKLPNESFPKKYKSHDINLRGAEKEQDPNKTEYKLLAEEALRKYELKSTIHYKVLEVKRVVTRVVAGFKYKIDFSASPTDCSVNVSSVHTRKCVAVDGDILHCHAEIWDRPWLKHKKNIVQCYGPDDNDLDEYETDSGATNDILKLSHVNNDEEKHKLLAEEASEKYLTATNRKYFHKVTAIHSVSEHMVDGTIIKIEYSMSPTKCLRNETRDSNDVCEIKKPLIVFHCTAKIWVRPWKHLDKDIKVTCKKSSKSKKEKPKPGGRNVRDIGDEDEDIDDDMIYYYADRAVQHVNDQSSSNNLHKLVTIHAVQNSMQMDTSMVRMYIELAETYCLRHRREVNLHQCEEMNGLDHRLCLARIWPSPDDELVIRHVSVVCDDDQEFESVTGLNIPELLKLSITNLEANPENHFKLVHQGAPQVIPSLNSQRPIKLSFIIATTNCSKDVNLDKNPFQCYLDNTISAKACHSFIWLEAEKRTVNLVDAKCRPPVRSKRSLSNLTNLTLDNLEIQKLVTESLQKLEMASLHRYKQRVLQINSHSTKITTGKVTTIDFDVGYTSCLKYEWVENITSCDFLEHLPRRRCVAQIWERLWINNGKNIDVNCVDDETPLESHIEFESAELANLLAKEALKHIEAKYPHPKKQKVVRIFSLEKQLVAGIHYRMKLEVGFTDCVALSEQTDCKLDKEQSLNKFCRVNVWIRPWTDHPPNFRVTCDFQEGATHDLYHHVQAEHLFYNFLTTYSPSYVNDYSQMQKRFDIFKANIKKIHELNVYEKGTATYGVTRFTDLSYDEFSTRFLGLKTSLRDANQLPMKNADIPDIKIPPNFDWREYDAVTEVKDQGSCGSCWAFSVTGNIEGQWKMQSGQLVSLSEQELVDCDKLDDGCNGGLPDNAYRAIEQLGGLELESDYPYEAEDEKCEFNKTLAKVQISGAVNITTNETGMAQWLVHNGPISIGINANAMQFYMGGISHPWKMLCNPTNLDHGVLIVGYGIKDYPLFHKRLPYWIVKNSWGKSWGEQGYYRVFRGDGTCGVNQMASSAVV